MGRCEGVFAVEPVCLRSLRVGGVPKQKQSDQSGCALQMLVDCTCRLWFLILFAAVVQTEGGKLGLSLLGSPPCLEMHGPL